MRPRSLSWDKRAYGFALGANDGIIIPLTALIITALVGVIITLIHFSYLNVVRDELQLAADAAALAGAGRLDSSRRGWEEARAAGVAVLNESNAVSGLSGDRSLAIDSDQDGTTWDLTAEKNLQVVIERGLWIADRAGVGRFTSWEGDWQPRNPGIPQFAASNAVRVALVRPAVRMLSSPFGGVPEYRIEAQSIAIRGRPDTNCIAPFAIPICALVDASGDFQKENICKGDRIFTTTNRYCPPEISPEDCAQTTRPSTPYTIVSSVYPGFSEGGDNGADDSANPPLDQPLWYVHGAALTLRDLLTIPGSNPEGYVTTVTHTNFTAGECAENTSPWKRQQAFSSVADHYGVVGLPGDLSHVEDLEAAILLLLSGGTPGAACKEASIGDRFQVLDPGLTSLSADEEIWSLINFRGDRYANSMLASIVKHVELLLFQVDNPSFDDYGFSRRHVCPNPRRDQGICNSHRGGYAFPRNGWVPGADMAMYAFRLYAGINDDSPLWTASIPVIAEVGEGAAACTGVSGVGSTPSRDPVLSFDKNYIVVGFVDVTFYDVDIGKPPPEYPIDVFNRPGETEPFPAEFRFKEPCNNVRGRVTCESNFIPTVEHTSVMNAHLVTGVRTP